MTCGYKAFPLHSDLTAAHLNGQISWVLASCQNNPHLNFTENLHGTGGDTSVRQHQHQLAMPKNQRYVCN